MISFIAGKSDFLLTAFYHLVRCQFLLSCTYFKHPLLEVQTVDFSDIIKQIGRTNLSG